MVGCTNIYLRTLQRSMFFLELMRLKKLHQAGKFREKEGASSIRECTVVDFNTLQYESPNKRQKIYPLDIDTY